MSYINEIRKSHTLVTFLASNVVGCLTPRMDLERMRLKQEFLLISWDMWEYNVIHKTIIILIL